jgi:hypothetical protein
MSCENLKFGVSPVYGENQILRASLYDSANPYDGASHPNGENPMACATRSRARWLHKRGGPLLGSGPLANPSLAVRAGRG